MSKKQKAFGSRRKPKYMDQLLVKSEQIYGKVGVFTIAVRHDDWCQIFKGGECDCNPIVDDPSELEQKG